MQLLNKELINLLLELSKVISLISVSLGIFIGLYGLYKSKKQLKISSTALNLSVLKQVDEIISKDTEIRKSIYNFLEIYKNGKLINNDLIETDLTIDISKSIFNKYQTGEAAYLSDELNDFRKIGRHYEKIGAVVKLGYLDFDLIFEVIPFPDIFWKDTKQLREAIKKNWYGKDMPLNDFWNNFSILYEMYLKKRENRK